jgi:hypothetical protein
LPLAALTDNQWAKSGQTLLQTLLGGERNLDFQELVIVPDSFLWYIPFETLSVETGGKRRPLIALNGKTLRYAPTASLGLPLPKISSKEKLPQEISTKEISTKEISNNATQSSQQTLSKETSPKETSNGATQFSQQANNAKKRAIVFLGKQTNKQNTKTASDIFTQWQKEFSDLQSLTPQQVTQSPPLVAKFIDELIVLSDLFPSDLSSGSYYDWSFFYGGSGENKANADDTRLIRGSAFGEWLRLPWGGPRLVMLSGYHTSAESAMQHNGELGDGGELFIPLTALLSCGADTIIIGRWQSGGQSSYNIIENFLKVREQTTGKTSEQNVINTLEQSAQTREQNTISQAWQRAVLETASAKLSASNEPRIAGTSAEKANLDSRANHPFFWGAWIFVSRVGE